MIVLTAIILEITNQDLRALFSFIYLSILTLSIATLRLGVTSESPFLPFHYCEVGPFYNGLGISAGIVFLKAVQLIHCEWRDSLV